MFVAKRILIDGAKRRETLLGMAHIQSNAILCCESHSPDELKWSGLEATLVLSQPVQVIKKGHTMYGVEKVKALD